MLDTIRLTFNMAIEKAQLETWRLSMLAQPNGFRVWEHRNNHEFENGAALTTFYREQGFRGQPTLSLEFSLPRLITGSNLFQIRDIPRAASLAEKLVDQIDWLPELSFEQGRLTRTDLMYDHQVGDNLPFYISALSRLEHPHRPTRSFLHTGVTYPSRASTLTFYDKFEESGEEAARGLLRQELRLRGRSRIQQCLGTDNLLEIPPEAVREALTEQLRVLNIADGPLVGGSSAILRLVERYGEYAGVYFFGFLIAREDIPRQQLAEGIEFSPTTLNNRIRSVVDEVEIWPILTDIDGELPPLSVNIGSEGDSAELTSREAWEESRTVAEEGMW